MDRDRFDALARLLAAKGSRRGVMIALLGTALFGHDPDEGLAKPGKGKGKGRDKGKGNDRGKGNNRNQKKRGKQRQSGNSSSAQTEAVACCGALSCARPAKGANRQKCNYAGQDLSGVIAKGAGIAQIDGRGTIFSTAANPSNWSGVNFFKACLQNSTWNRANLSGANFDQTCLFDADLTGAIANASTNLGSAKLCRTTMPDGAISDRDCDKGTACCPACEDDGDCQNGHVCCNGRCRSGDCCSDGDCNGGLCCNGRCRDGECCVAGDCANRVCQAKSCTDFQCRHRPATGGSCQASDGTTGVCCNGVCCPSGQQCSEGQCIACNQQTCSSGCCTTNGVCVTPPTNQRCGITGATCRSCTGNTPVCDSTSGQCVQCTVANDCPVPANPCLDRVCNANGTCGMISRANDSTCSTTNGNGICCSGECKVDDPHNCVACGSPCTTGTCKVGTCNDKTCSTTNEPNGTPCMVPGEGPGVCNGGTCVQCIVADDCPDPGQCRARSCVNNICMPTTASDGTSCQTLQGVGVCYSGSCTVGAPNGLCETCVSPTSCPIPEPRCRINTCLGGFCGTAPLNNQTAEDCGGGFGRRCCNGVCVTTTDEQCPVCCQGEGQGTCPATSICVSSEACGQVGIAACALTEQCCVALD